MKNYSELINQLKWES